MPLSKAAYGRIALLLLACGFLLLVGLAASVVVLTEQNSAAMARATASLRAQAALHEALSALQDAETGQRGFLLTGEATYLEPYIRAARVVGPTLDRLADLIGADQEEPTALPTLRRLADDKMAELAATLALARSGDTAGALALVRSNRGLATMEHFRARIGQLNIASGERLAEASADQARTARWLLFGAIGCAVLIVAVAIGCAILLRGYLRQLDAAAGEVRAANESLERRVAERTADLAEANAEIQRFAYIVSHDLRSPLVNVMGFTAELEAALKDLMAAPETAGPNAPTREALESDIAEAIGFIRAATGRMDRLINAILRLSREGNRRLEPRRLDMAAVLDGIAASLSHQLSETGTEITIERPMPAITADRMATEQVFANLLDNAVKYLDPARPGRISVQAHTLPGGAQVAFEVTDNGRGIAPEDRERVFELFRRAGAQDRPGEGIGLAHVRAVVRRLGGTITCAPAARGAGTTFHVTLPARPSAEIPTVHAGAATESRHAE